MQPLPTESDKLVDATIQTQSPSPSWKIKLLYDGACPLCLREVNFLQKRDAGRGLINFVDITCDRYNPEENGGIDFETAMGRIHAVLADGRVIKNVEVFRQVYETLDMGWVYAATKWPLVGAVVDFLYGIWADWRLALTGRADLQTLVREQQQQQLDVKTEGRCRLNG